MINLVKGKGLSVGKIKIAIGQRVPAGYWKLSDVMSGRPDFFT
jgi:hypothetical protein